MPPLARNLALIALPPQVAGFVLLVILLGGDFPDFILGIGTLAVLGLLVASILYCLPITVPYVALLSILKVRRGWAGAGISAVLLGGLAVSVVALVGFLFAYYIPWDVLLHVAAVFAFTGLPMSLFLPEGKAV
ncbi:hypothetical protein [Neisseria elongata]|uniref:Uncharacterized protein n=1 Tax=Neisseria elongata subsp. nitroreducens TaxID=90367 RepID=A0A9X0ZVU6_NEIEL|nr:hypothetical protein [Neisseria elongata]MBS9341468.1 hypothetical protein [Neisseria elongata subsp. nitroreducens]